MLIFILIDVQYSQKAVFSFEKGSNRQNHSSSGSFHLVKKFPPVKFPIPHNPLPLFGRPQYIKLYAPFLWMGCNCLKAIQSHYEETVYFLPDIPGIYPLSQSRKDERLRWPWNHPVVLNLCINLVITKSEIKSKYVKLTQLWPLTVKCFQVLVQVFSVISGKLIKDMFL